MRAPYAPFMLAAAALQGETMKFPLAIRAAVVLLIALALLIPLAVIKDKIAERRDRAAQVQTDYAAETSGPQAVAGPFLALTCEETYVHENIEWKGDKPMRQQEKRKRPCATGLFQPARLAVDGEVPLEPRHRGIYPIRFYRAKLAFSAQFGSVPPPPWGGTDIQREWKEAYLVLAVSDVRGIKATAPFRFNEREMAFAPGAFDTAIKSGL